MKLLLSLGFLSAFFLTSLVSAQDKKLIIKVPHSSAQVQEKSKTSKSKTAAKKVEKPLEKVLEKPLEPVVEKPVEKVEVAEPMEVWQMSSARGLKKKILFSAFSIAKPNQVVDIDDPAQGFPNEILKHLQQHRLVLPRFTPDSLLTQAQQTEVSPSMIRQVAGQYDSQYIVTGHIRHADEKVEPKMFGLWNKHKRTLEIEVVIYEGQSGVALSRKMFTGWAADDIKIGRDKAFASAGFEVSSFGKVIRYVILQASDWIAQEVETYPLLARIIKVENDHIIFDAGSSSFISSGDVGVLIAESDSLPVMALRSVQHNANILGSSNQTLGLVKVQSTQTTFAQAQLARDVKRDAVKVGQWVRFESKP
jgi:TolB-like protein